MKKSKTFPIDQFPWDGGLGYRPEAFARLSRDEEGIHAQLRARQASPRCEVTQCGGAVCQDDCLEFFLAPRAASDLYLNLESNATGVYHLGLGAGRHGRAVFTSPAEGLSVTPVREGEYWGVDVTISPAFFARWFGGQPDQVMRGNFYKCGDATERPHWGMWAPYDLPKPDFHRPELFPDIIL